MHASNSIGRVSTVLVSPSIHMPMHALAHPGLMCEVLVMASWGMRKAVEAEALCSRIL